MSTTGNEFEEPGVNYPDSAKEAPAEERSDVGVGGAVASEDESAGAATRTQDGPALAQNTTTDDERLEGVVQQVRADVGGEGNDIVETSLRRRLHDVGLTVSDDEITALVRDIAGD